MGCNPQKNNCYYFSRHLWETLADIPTYGLTVIEAPSGFGKTTALREYLAREQKMADVRWSRFSLIPKAEAPFLFPSENFDK